VNDLFFTIETVMMLWCWLLLGLDRIGSYHCFDSADTSVVQRCKSYLRFRGTHQIVGTTSRWTWFWWIILWIILIK
jgi:hypothetical protein